MTTFKQFFNPAKAGLNVLSTAVTTGTVKLKYKSAGYGTRNKFWEGVWEWSEGYNYLDIVLTGEEIDVSIMSNGYMNDGHDTIQWRSYLPERTYLRIYSYLDPKKPGVQPDIKAGTVELEAWLESPTVSKQIKNKIQEAKRLGFRYFPSREAAERWGQMI